MTCDLRVTTGPSPNDRARSVFGYPLLQVATLMSCDTGRGCQRLARPQGGAWAHFHLRPCEISQRPWPARAISRVQASLMGLPLSRGWCGPQRASRRCWHPLPQSGNREGADLSRLSGSVLDRVNRLLTPVATRRRLADTVGRGGGACPSASPLGSDLSPDGARRRHLCSDNPAPRATPITWGRRSS